MTRRKRRRQPNLPPLRSLRLQRPSLQLQQHGRVETPAVERRRDPVQPGRRLTIRSPALPGQMAEVLPRPGLANQAQFNLGLEQEGRSLIGGYGPIQVDNRHLREE